MSSLIKRRYARFARMQDTTQAVYAAMFEAARRHSDAREAARLAATAYRIQTCHRTTRFVVHRPKDDAPWIGTSTPNACMSPWCMACARKRAKHLRRVLDRILLAIWQERPLIRASLLTLSSRNLKLSDTEEMLHRHTLGLNRYFARKEVKQSHYGALHCIELAVRANGREIGVHSHHLQLIDDACMGTDRYLEINRIKKLWAESLRIDYVPICDVRAVKANADGDMHAAVHDACRETAKYCLKPLSLISLRPHDLFGTETDSALYVDPDLVLNIAPAIRGRRLLRMTGLWKKAAAKLKASSELDGASPS